MAVKIIRKSAIENQQDLLRIRREIRIMSALSHPNIIEIYEGLSEIVKPQIVYFRNWVSMIFSVRKSGQDHNCNGICEWRRII